MDITYHIRQNQVIVSKELYVGCEVGTPDRHYGRISDIFGDKAVVVVDDSPISYKKSELVALEIKISLFGLIQLPKKVNPTGQKLEIILLEDVFQKQINNVTFYHEIPSISLKEKGIIMYYCNSSKINSEIEEYLADLYDETIYDFMNISDYVEHNISRPMMNNL